MQNADGPSLLNDHRTLVRRGRLTGPEAEDLASEAIARVLQRPAPDGRRGPWLERVFANLVADHWRGRARRGGAGLPAPAAAPSPEESLAQAEAARLLAAALPALPDEQGQALRLRFWEDQGYDEVAASQGVAEATARTRVHRGLAALRGLLGGMKVWLPLGSAPATALAPAVLVALVAAPGWVPPPPSVAVAAPRVAQAAPRPARPAPVRPAPAPPPAVAAPARPAAAPRPAATAAPAPVPAAAVTRYDYDNDEVTGELQSPDGLGIVGGPPSAPHPSLIEIPSSFVPAIAKSIDEL